MSKVKVDKGIIAGSIDHQKIVWVVVAIIVAFGIYALAKMKKRACIRAPIPRRWKPNSPNPLRNCCFPFPRWTGKTPTP